MLDRLPAGRHRWLLDRKERLTLRPWSQYGNDLELVWHIHSAGNCKSLLQILNCAPVRERPNRAASSTRTGNRFRLAPESRGGSRRTANIRALSGSARSGNRRWNRDSPRQTNRYTTYPGSDSDGAKRTRIYDRTKTFGRQRARVFPHRVTATRRPIRVRKRGRAVS